MIEVTDKEQQEFNNDMKKILQFLYEQDWTFEHATCILSAVLSFIVKEDKSDIMFRQMIGTIFLNHMKFRGFEAEDVFDLCEDVLFNITHQEDNEDIH